jgi:dihydroorotate dehydrogenase electron transfer subunit
MSRQVQAVAAGSETLNPGAAVRVTGEVYATKRVGVYQLLTILVEGIAERYRPGTLLFLAVGGPLSHVVGRRAHPVYRVRAAGVRGGSVDLVVQSDEPGNAWVAALRPLDRVDVLGPLGRPFALPREPASCALVGVGRHVAPLFGLAEQLRERRCTVHMVQGAAHEAALFGVLEAKRSAHSVTMSTDDGSVGVKGDIDAPLSHLLQREPVDVVYVSGGLATVRAVTALAAQHGAWVQALVDAPMPCGTGICGGCMLPMRGTDGFTRPTRLCTDGPVVRGDRIAWDEVES